MLFRSVVISEHIGYQVVTSEIVGRDLLKDPGLHRTFFSDGVSTVLLGCFGSVPTTTYGENIGVMAITKVFSVRVISGAAVFSILLAFFAPASALINSIPAPVMGNISFLLYGMIGASGIRLALTEENSYQYGPVCVDRDYRGRGVFERVFAASLYSDRKSVV